MIMGDKEKASQMLYISRKEGESIVINDGITVTLVEVKGKTAKIGIQYPPGTQIYRGELYARIQQENRAAVTGLDILKEL